MLEKVLSLRKKIILRKILFFLFWLLLIKFVSAIFEITNMRSYFTMKIQAIIVFLPFGLTAMHFVVRFITACFKGTIKKFSLDYAELAIVAFMVCYIGYIKLTNLLSEWLYGVLLNIYGFEAVVHSLPERFLMKYFSNIINDTESELYFLLLPICIVLVIFNMRLQNLSVNASSRFGVSISKSQS